ncbi:COG4315 family predicted lipoprotein [Microlunatus flavus]|uniref:Predicted lipoprotein with conserved Yx(FWY)xxD motif n=1 Tax=Microlunatus flavus TaxID=1036181 RepID=A0A1H9N904_9ACTN|nr:hypothetical protein [Microlunatus flavus]SER32466.1 Predicted lipoprotein with conserved Yx(FWY)xxD motif [Microlunatus flavus]
MTGGALVLVALAACSSPAGSAPAAEPAPASSASSSAPSAAATSAAAGADLKVASTSLGSVVVDSQGRTAYYFDKDKAGSGTSVCSGDCLAAWPAIAPAGSTPTVEGVTAKVGTIKRDDGSAQITLEGRPVYLFVKDKAAGDVTGQGVGGVWYVIAPDGTEVKKSAG